MNGSPIWKFHGSRDLGPMWWSVDIYDFAVVESYDQGKTWGVNCRLANTQDCWDFIAFWFSQFYEGT
jgi:hypothetical protein